MSNPSIQEQTERLYQRCSDLFVHGHYEDSLLLSNQLIALDEHNPTYYVDRADTYYAMRRYSNAAADYERAIALQPGTYAYINLGTTYEKLGRFEEALRQYDAVIALQMDYVAIAHHNRGDTLTSLKRLPEALAAFEQAIKRDPEFAGAYLNRGHVLSRLGRREEARADYDQAYTLGAQDINIAWTVTWSRFGRSPLKVQDTDHLLKIAHLHPGDRHYVSFMCLAVVAFQSDDVPLALSHLERASAMDPDQWDPPFWRGMVAAWTGEYTSAQRAIENALELGLPPAFLKPLYWLKETHPVFFGQYARTVLERFP